jgi:hypothetical protein
LFIVTEMTIAGARAKLSSMKTLAATATVLLLVSAPLVALAQETVAGVPDTSYEASGVASAAAEPELPFPDTDPGGDGSTVTVPIPGGGNVTVEGPATPDENPSVSSPIETWADRTQTPNNVTGTTPLGP